MNIEYKNFIGVYNNVYPEGYCQHLIKQFDDMETGGAGSDRIKFENAAKHVKNDYQIILNVKGSNIENFNDQLTANIFFNGLQQCYEDYIKEYSILRDGSIRATSMKMQRTPPGGGYHIWHAEHGRDEFANRVLVYMLYLNTLEPEQAGETEFLYQQERFRPVENTMIIWPAAFTHAHRGNTVFGNDSKYIVTGWFNYN
jgi:hypothetical protein